MHCDVTAVHVNLTLGATQHVKEPVLEDCLVVLDEEHFHSRTEALHTLKRILEYLSIEFLLEKLSTAG